MTNIICSGKSGTIPAKRVAYFDLNLKEPAAFGITPDYPEIDYGCIKLDELTIVSLKEKSNAKTTQRHVDTGSYHWNSIMFCFGADTFLKKLKFYAPVIYEASKITHRFWETCTIIEDAIGYKSKRIVAKSTKHLNF